MTRVGYTADEWRAMSKAQRRRELDALRPLISAGTVFDTEYEQGCIAHSTPDEVGNFDATDSDGVVCSFSLAMVWAMNPE